MLLQLWFINTHLCDRFSAVAEIAEALQRKHLVFLPTWLVQTDIAQGRLMRVLPDISTFSTTLHAVYPSRKYLSAKVRTFMDFLASLESAKAAL